MEGDGEIRILVVEDNATQAHLLKISLTRRGFEVHQARTLAQALQFIKETDIDVILLDLSLPDSDGIQTFYDAYSAANGIPIVVLTALNDQQVAYTALKSGAQDYLVKGVPSDESVVRCLRYAIQRQQFETDLWQSERRTRLILEHATDAFFATDESGIVVTWNFMAERTFGYLRKDAIGQPLVGLIIPVKYRQSFNNQQRHFVNGDRETTINSRMEMTMRRQDGREFMAEVALFAIDESNARMFCGFVRNITYRKQLDEGTRAQLNQNLIDRMADVERTNNDLQKYNRTITIDLRKRLELILQHELMLKWKLRERTDPEVERSLAALCSETEKLINMMQPLADEDTHLHQSTIIRNAQSQTWSGERITPAETEIENAGTESSVVC